ncbi:DUF3592 domain-containing protein [Goodfellowiella coeruleoviolacea]|uniref:Uncharacterized protein n=1 Tax=Goodfellowiella coeruleoviolacea TaxID=334858 RepID=A0AAE3KM35_9PSEU|nr:hypothetical protein [Goodfellowiella coeruleoviolacea]MCP2167153.1 hypothetical protein [Goodfellowiella coeruleoviolacea]
MRNLVRSSVLLVLLAAFGFYLWYGITNQSGEPGLAAWVGPQLIAPIGAISLLPTAFTLTRVFAAIADRDGAEFRDGLVGVGTVVAAAPTGVSVNDQPEVRVDLTVRTADGQVFDSQARLVVPLTEVALLRPGALLPVRYLPGRTDRVAVDRSGDTSAAQEALNQQAVRDGLTTPERLEIARRGVAAQAVVTSLSVPGQIRNGNARVCVGLVVTRPDGSSFTAEVDRFLPPRAVEHVQVGRVVTAHYLPENEREVVLALPANA